MTGPVLFTPDTVLLSYRSKEQQNRGARLLYPDDQGGTMHRMLQVRNMPNGDWQSPTNEDDHHVYVPFRPTSKGVSWVTPLPLLQAMACSYAAGRKKNEEVAIAVRAVDAYGVPLQDILPACSNSFHLTTKKMKRKFKAIILSTSDEV